MGSLRSEKVRLAEKISFSSSGSSDPSKGIFYSFVLPVYNRAYLIKKVLSSLFQQGGKWALREGYEFEVVVVDDGSTDDTPRIVEGCFSENPRLIFYRQKNSGPSAARNRGVELARGEIIHFVDSDIIAPLDLMENHLIHHLKRNDLIVQGQLVRVSSSDEIPVEFSVAHYSGSHFDTANVSVRKEHILAVGGFDEKNFKKGWEDLDLGLRLIKERKLKVRKLFSKGYVWHVENITSESIFEFYEDRFNEGLGGVRFYKKHRSFSSRLMTLAGREFLFLDRVLFGPPGKGWPYSEKFLKKIEGLFKKGRKTAAINWMRIAGYHAYMEGIREGLKRFS